MAIDGKRVVALFKAAERLRQPYEDDWKMLAAHALPRDYREWQSGSRFSSYGNNSSVRETRQISFDATAAKALDIFVAICERLATPRTQRWHKLEASDSKLQSMRGVAEWFETADRKLWSARYRSTAGFVTAQANAYQSLGLYGNGPKFITKRLPTAHDPRPGLRYIATRMASTYVLQDENGEINFFFRLLKYNARQAKAAFGEEKLPKQVRAELVKATPSEDTFFPFVHCVMPASDYDPQALDRRRLPWVGVYVDLKEAELVKEPDGYLTKPFVFARTFTSAEECYGVSPGLRAYPAIVTASQIKKTMLKQGQKAVDPTLLVHDDGVLSGPVDQRPGRAIFGGVNAQGKPLVQPLVTGNFQVAENLLAGERKDIIEAFYAHLFEKLMEDPNLTATQVVNMVADRAAILSPLMGKLQTEDTGQTIERELSLLVEMGELPPLPPELVEAKGEYSIIYTSPQAKAERAEEVAGFQRTVEFATGVATALQDPAPLRRFNFDKAIPEIARIQGVPTDWMKTDDEMAEDEGQQQQAQRAQQLTDSAPALASIATTAMKLNAGQAPR